MNGPSNDVFYHINNPMSFIGICNVSIMSPNFFLNTLIYLLVITGVAAKVDPPNYNFSLDRFKEFFPKKDIKKIDKKYGKGEYVARYGNFIVKKYYIDHLRYKFPIFVQMNENLITDFYARLPGYFLHDVFHQSLINRFGKKYSFIKKESNSSYRWVVDGLVHDYEATCTITCFPIFYSIAPKSGESKVMGFRSLHSRFTNNK